MARIVGKLTALRIGRDLAPGFHADGAGLYLQVTSGNAKSWVYRFSFPAVSLADARTKAVDCRALQQEGVDPIEARKTERAQAALEAAKAITFKEAARQYIAAHRAAWKNAKHASQWESTLETYAYPVIGAVSVPAVDTVLVVKILEPIWTAKSETASRVRGRIERILDWAKSRGLRSGENPARWRGHLEFQFPARSKVRKARHHPALPYKEIGAFMNDLRQRDGVAARALEFVILTAARTGDIIGNDRDDKPPMERSHVGGRIWTVPSTKTDTEHSVPLSASAMAVLDQMKAHNAAVIFPGVGGGPLSNMSMAAVIERMNDGRAARKLPRYLDPKQNGRDVTVHGFRSTFRDWAAECTNYPNEVVEMALAHAVGDKVEAAYRRGDLFEKRRKLMEAWGAYCDKQPVKQSSAIRSAA